LRLRNSEGNLLVVAWNQPKWCKIGGAMISTGLVR
jgi:hypothetical protein